MSCTQFRGHSRFNENGFILKGFQEYICDIRVCAGSELVSGSWMPHAGCNSDRHCGLVSEPGRHLQATRYDNNRGHSRFNENGFILKGFQEYICDIRVCAGSELVCAAVQSKHSGSWMPHAGCNSDRHCGLVSEPGRHLQATRYASTNQSAYFLSRDQVSFVAIQDSMKMVSY
jgi:hypothetical protein